MTRVSVPSSSGETVRSCESGSARIRRSTKTAVALAGRDHRSRNGSGNGAVHAARGAAFRKERGATPRGLGARAVPRGSVTRQKLSFASRRSRPERDGPEKDGSEKNRVTRAAGSGRRSGRRNERSEKVLRANAIPRKPFTRLGGAGLGLRVIRPEIARAIAGRRRWT
jgi:hypothetical protein